MRKMRMILGNNMQKLSFTSFNLEATLDSGQIFRYWHDSGDDFWYVQHDDFVMKLRQKQNFLFFAGAHADGREVSEAEVRHFFRLDKSHDRMVAGLGQDTYISGLSRKYRGIHLIRQESFECIISFMCSSASNIPKIKMNVKMLSEAYGKKFMFEGKQHSAFPKPGSLKSLDKILAAKTGFRARYIHQANGFLTPQLMQTLKRSSYPKAREILLSINGIGDKIANCILLFSLGHVSSFPVDTWMRKAMLDKYSSKMEASVSAKVNRGKAKEDRVSARITERRMSEFGETYFGESAGLAQQYIYVHARSKK